MTTARYEGLCAGRDQTVVSSAVVCYAPTVDVLRRAAAEKRNLIIGREHPFFLHGGWHYSYTTDGLEAATKDDPVVAGKREIVNSGPLVVYRYGWAWDQFDPKAQSRALAQAMGLVPLPSTDRRRGVVCNLPRTSIAKLAQNAADRLKTRAPRVVGDLSAAVTRAAVLAGETDPTPALAQLLADPNIDCLIAGAGGVVDEVDGAIAYFRDIIATGRKIVLLAVGYGPSHEPGVAEMAKWLKVVLPVPVDYWPVPDPSWIPRPNGGTR